MEMGKSHEIQTKNSTLCAILVLLFSFIIILSIFYTKICFGFNFYVFLFVSSIHMLDFKKIHNS
jgi:uncharacterized membrane protein